MQDGKVFPADEMTSRQRLLAAYRGQQVDRLPYWAKIANPTWRSSQPGRIRDMPETQLLDYIHADGLFGVPRAISVDRPHVTVRSTIRNGRRTTVTHTPDGDLVDRWSLDPYTQSWHPSEFPVKTHEDIARLRWFYTDVRVETDEDALAAAKARAHQVGQRGVILTWMGTSPLMDLVEHLVGPVETTYMLADCPDRMDELIELMHQARMVELSVLAAGTPADVIISGENTSTTLISPQQFERYCYGHLCDYGRLIEAAGKMHEMHMCGKLLALLERIDTIPAASIEAFTSPTLGDTRLADGRTRSPSKTLIGGTNVNVWLRPIKEIKSYILAELGACPDRRRIVLTTAGVAPPGCPAETFRKIGRWITTVPVAA